MDDYKPPFHLTDKMTALIAQISEQVGRITVLHGGTINPRLRRGNRIRTIHSSLAIEHNSLSLEQVTAVLDGKRVLGDPNEIREVRNAYEAYELMLRLDPASVEDLLTAHRLMMNGLVPGNGKFRSGGVGVFDGDALIHMAPPAALVPEHVENLFAWYRQSELHPLIKSAIFHYEFEFVHPFEDGNGRMGRMWHSLLLGRWKELFFWLPIEELVQSRQKDYYDALAEADRQADSAVFVELMLEIVRDSLDEAETGQPAPQAAGPGDQVSDQVNDQVNDQVSDQVNGEADGQDAGRIGVRAAARESSPDGTPAGSLLAALGDETLSAAELMARLGLSHRANFRRNYLGPALARGVIERTVPDKPNSRNQKYRRKKPA